jgi:hypothetical protein
MSRCLGYGTNTPAAVIGGFRAFHLLRETLTRRAERKIEVPCSLSLCLENGGAAAIYIGRLGTGPISRTILYWGGVV